MLHVPCTVGHTIRQSFCQPLLRLSKIHFEKELMVSHWSLKVVVESHHLHNQIYKWQSTSYRYNIINYIRLIIFKRYPGRIGFTRWNRFKICICLLAMSNSLWVYTDALWYGIRYAAYRMRHTLWIRVRTHIGSPSSLLASWNIIHVSCIEGYWPYRMVEHEIFNSIP